MNILAASDTHLKSFEIQSEWINQVDVVIHAGDLLNAGTYDEFVRALDLLVIQLKELNCNLCIITPGNHDNIFENNLEKYLQ